jgi:hypothetical protein
MFDWATRRVRKRDVDYPCLNLKGDRGPRIWSLRNGYGGFLSGFYQNTKTEKRKTLIC